MSAQPINVLEVLECLERTQRDRDQLFLVATIAMQHLQTRHMHLRDVAEKLDVEIGAELRKAIELHIELESGKRQSGGAR